MESPLRGTAQEQGMSDLRVIETMRWDGTRLLRLDRHLARLERTCAELGFGCDVSEVLAALNPVAGGAKRLRLTIGQDGSPEVTIAGIAPNPALWRVTISDHRLDPADKWLRLKTTKRALYDASRANLPVSVDEIIFCNTRGELCEGTISNLFVDFGGGLLTPALSCGLLPGILREEMLENGDCREAVLIQSDLSFAKRMFAGNSLRGLIPLQLA